MLLFSQTLIMRVQHGILILKKQQKWKYKKWKKKKKIVYAFALS